MREAAPSAEAFGLFVSSVEGRPVTRFGTKVLIGADRDPKQPNKIQYRTKDIVAIPVAEADRFAREYGRLVADGDLTAHTAEQWQQQTQHRAEVGAPRKKLASGVEPDQPTAKDATNADHEGGSQLG
jgi:hypothetical protein